MKWNSWANWNWLLRQTIGSRDYWTDNTKLSLLHPRLCGCLSQFNLPKNNRHTYNAEKPNSKKSKDSFLVHDCGLINKLNSSRRLTWFSTKLFMKASGYQLLFCAMSHHTIYQQSFNFRLNTYGNEIQLTSDCKLHLQLNARDLLVLSHILKEYIHIFYLNTLEN